MSPETRVERRRLSRSKRARIRTLKAQRRHEMGTVRPNLDSYGRAEFEKYLRLKFGPEYQEKYAPHFPVLNEFRLIREEIRIGGFKKELVDTFQDRHGTEILSELGPALRLTIEYVGK